MGPLQSFQFFPHLPTELRLKIWGHALCNPRVLNITCDKGSRPHGTGTRRYAEAFTCSAPTPALLYTNHESRFCALSTYNGYFSANSPIYISFAQDSIRLADGVLDYLPKEVILGVEKLAVEVQQPDQFPVFHFDTLKKMTRLRRLDLLVQGDLEHPWSSRPWWTFLKRDFEHEMQNYPEVCIIVFYFLLSYCHLAVKHVS